jgi:hypothetical protein
MALEVFGNSRDGEEVVILNSAGKPLTGLSQQDILASAGYLLEAATARSALVEAVLLSYLLVARQVSGVGFDATTLQRLSDERITFGQVNKAIHNANAYHDATLLSDVDAFVDNRNHVAHHLAFGNKSFDLKAFFQAGRPLALRLWSHVVHLSLPHRKKILSSCAIRG